MFSDGISKTQNTPKSPPRELTPIGWTVSLGRDQGLSSVLHGTQAF
ncbi:hypothetical protein LCGC14_0109350 [marine sediment metagenome]|uniref:Uncharacterized protein n=1 Tax=marine sediment metagenome TaxID=412755 RepID=A0A0F9VQ60_9ZZZZ